jgi:hypothetical protein
LHATAFACSMPSAYPDLMGVVHAIVDEDLANGGFHPREEPPADNRNAEVAAELSELLIRRGKLVGGSWEKARDESLSKTEALVDESAELLNGDLSKPRTQHYCYKDGCSDGHKLSVAVSRIVAMYAALIFTGLPVNLPAANRWYTFGPHLSFQYLGMVVHRILPRCVKRAFTVRVLA